MHSEEILSHSTFTTFPSIPGLILYENLLSHEQQNELVNGIIEANYFDNLESNQAMCFGTLPSFVLHAIEIISNTSGFFPEEILSRKPLFNQACDIIKRFEAIKKKKNSFSTNSFFILIINSQLSIYINLEKV